MILIVFSFPTLISFLLGCILAEKIYKYNKKTYFYIIKNKSILGIFIITILLLILFNHILISSFILGIYIYLFLKISFN